MKKNILSYSAPEIEIFEVAVEGGYGNSTLLPQGSSQVSNACSSPRLGTGHLCEGGKGQQGNSVQKFTTN